MKHDISESVSQGSSGAETSENRRIIEVSDAIRRGCKLYEAKFRVGSEHVGLFEAEQRVAEQYAKEHNIWVPITQKGRFLLCNFRERGRRFRCSFFALASSSLTK